MTVSLVSDDAISDGGADHRDDDDDDDGDDADDYGDDYDGECDGDGDNEHDHVRGSRYARAAPLSLSSLPEAPARVYPGTPVTRVCPRLR